MLKSFECLKSKNGEFNSEFRKKLYENKHIVEEMYNECGNKFHYGCGSYLFDGKKFEYCNIMLPKQELLFNVVKNVETVLEIGGYVGHSLLIMLLSNPNLKITCIDISDEYAKPAINVLNKYFNNAVKFIHNDSLKELPILREQEKKYDFFHVDGCHKKNYPTYEFNHILKLNNKHDSLQILFDDKSCMKELIKYIENNYEIIKKVDPNCTWSNIYYELKM